MTASSSVSCQSDADELRNQSSDLKHPDQQASGAKIRKCVLAHSVYCNKQGNGNCCRRKAENQLSKQCNSLKSLPYTTSSNALRNITCSCRNECPGRYQGTLLLMYPASSLPTSACGKAERGQLVLCNGDVLR